MSRPRTRSKHEPEVAKRVHNRQGGGDESVPLTPEELRRANETACKLFTPTGGHVLREPDENAYGVFRVLRRTDNLFVVVAPHLYTKGPVFWTENGARAWAKRESEKKLPTE
jgi:hypothetical protein